MEDYHLQDEEEERLQQQVGISLLVHCHWLWNIGHRQNHFFKGLKGIAFYGKPIVKFQHVTCHMGSHEISCHSTQVNELCLNPSHEDRYSIYPAWRDGRLS